MSSTTKRWMKAELEQLLAQRERYELAEATARDVAQLRRRTVRLRAIDEEILGHWEALRALEPEPTPARRRSPTRVSPTIGASLGVMQAPARGTAALAKIVGSSFAVGFGLTALALWSATPPAAAATATVAPAAATSPAPAKAPRATPAIDDTVLAGPAPADRRRNGRR